MLRRSASKLNKTIHCNYKLYSPISCYSFSSTAVPFVDSLEIPKYGVDPQHLDVALKSFLPTMLEKSEHFLGYQANNDLPPVDSISKLLEIHMNNAGDPYIDTYCKTHCKTIERSVMRYCAELWNDDPRIDSDPNHPENFWGYVLNMGSTEGNLNALWNAREYFINNNDDSAPMVFFSKDTHYSVPKSCGILSLPQTIIDSDQYGRINIDKLCEKVENTLQKSPRPIIIVYNMGTTFKGAYDDAQTGIAEINKIVDKYNIKYWNHLDGALGGFIVPFLRRGILEGNIIEQEKYKDTNQSVEIPEFGFNLDVQSCNASFYKWFGAPYPTGIFMTQNKYLRKADTPDYIGSPDTTLGGGRNAFSALYIWWRLQLTDYNNEILSVSNCLNNAKYLENELNKIDVEMEGRFNVDVARSPYSFSTTFNSPSPYISNKYSIPQEMEEIFDDNGKKIKQVSRSHIYSMKHVTKPLIDEFLEDYRNHAKENKLK